MVRHIETLVETGHGEAERRDARNWCVGIALDVEGGKLYWTQKGNDNAGEGRILRANLEIPKGQTPLIEKISKSFSATCLSLSI